ncbi:hypothetical protein H5410_059459 [Solanum commersonii]|uniref:Uncharacterized protein n=1 Tax=Solanum commersonii TaxID=4109 RepID=A0A9J5W2H8_SOLCO|nr:hypothetical protein H5410_059459 [Solanum commersonii]
MCGRTRRNRIRNEDIGDKVRVVSMEDKMREVILRWFRHVKRRCTDASMQKCQNLAMGGLGEVEEMMKQILIAMTSY